jgi:hypothetical protein
MYGNTDKEDCLELKYNEYNREIISQFKFLLRKKPELPEV